MVQHPDCPKCGNTNFEIIDLEISKVHLRAVKCLYCSEILWIYQDNAQIVDELKERIDDIESSLSDIEDEISRTQTI